MKIDENKTFKLFPCCVLVSGAKKAAIYDLQRELYYLIPLSLYDLLSVEVDKSINQIVEDNIEYSSYIYEYFDFLIEKELGVMCDLHDNLFAPIELKYSVPKLITNAVFDYDEDSIYSICDAIEQLDNMKCENLELRFFSSISNNAFQKVIEATKYTSLRDIELLIPYNILYSVENLIGLHQNNPRIKKITVFNTPKFKERIFQHEEIHIIYTSEKISDETCCGEVNEWYYLPKTELYIESRLFNNCLNNKISIDRKGEIKNCPSMSKSYGNIKSNRLIDVAKMKVFQEIWHIKKDDIKICRDCELRYMCQDCRAYIKDPLDLFSKPLKCKYDPYN